MKLYDWQQKEIDTKAHIKKWGILVSPRCGKSLASFESLRANIKPGDKPKVLVVCPVAVGGNWCKLLAELGIPVYPLYYGRVVERATTLQNLKAPFAVVINIDTIKFYTEILVKLKIDYFILDESHNIANPNAKRSKACRRIANVVPWYRPLTGTPTGGTHHKFWAQLQPTNPELWGKTFASFRREHLVMSPIFPQKVDGYIDEPRLLKMVADSATIIRRADVFGPDQWVNIKRSIDLPDRAKKLYKALVDDFLIDEGSLTVDATHILTRLVRQQQLTSGFVTNDHGEIVDIHTAKLDAVEVDIDSIVNQGEKAIIFHRWKWESRKYTELASRYCPTFTIAGDVGIEKRDALIEKFRTHKGSMVGVVQIESGGVGISLAESDHALRVSRSFSFIKDTQALDRIFKPGSVRTVTDYECDGTVDTLISKTLAKRLDVHNIIMSLPTSQLLYPE